MTTVPDFDDLALRHEALFKEAVTGSVGSTEYMYSPEALPYFQAGVLSYEIVENGQEIDQYTVTTVVRHAVGKLTEGYDGELETAIRDQVRDVTAYVRKRRYLQSAAYPTRMTGLMESRLISGRSVVIPGSDGTQIAGWEYTTVSEFTFYVEQVYT